MSIVIRLVSPQKITSQVADIQRGGIYELSCMRKRLSIPWVVFFENVESLTDSNFNVSFSCFKGTIQRSARTRAISIIFV